MSENKEKQRTIQQNRALHLFFTKISEALNDAGYDMRKTLKPGIEIPWTPEMVKEYLWRPVQELQLKKESTRDLTVSDIDKILNTLNRFMGEKLGIEVEFPSMDSLMFNETHNIRSNFKRKQPV